MNVKRAKIEVTAESSSNKPLPKRSALEEIREVIYFLLSQLCLKTNHFR